MVVRIVIASLMASVLMMAWGWFFWGFSGIPSKYIDRLPEEKDAVAAIRRHIAEPGMYHAPYWPAEKNPEACQAYQERVKAGPLLWIIYHAGEDMQDPIVYVRGFVHMIAMTLLAGGLLAMAAPRLPSYPARFGFVVVIGLLAATVALSDAVWFHHPWDFQLMVAGSALVSWILTALVLALLVKSPPPVVTG